MHILAPAAEKNPIAHEVQEDSPGVGVNVDALHWLHDGLASALNCPAGHWVQAAMDVALDCAWDVPATQLMQVTPLVPYVPGLHGTHWNGNTEVSRRNPAAQVQAV